MDFAKPVFACRGAAYDALRHALHGEGGGSYWKLWYMQQRALPYGTGAKSCLEAAPAPCPAVSAASKPAHAGRGVGHAGRAIGHAGSAGHVGPLAMLAAPLATLAPQVMLCPRAVCFFLNGTGQGS